MSTIRMQYVIDVEVETKRFGTVEKQNTLMDMIGGRAWTIDGVVQNGASIRLVGRDCVVISKAEYESMQHKLMHLESRLANLVERTS